jgi:hypothetical protein
VPRRHISDVTTLLADVRYALRLFARHPGMTAIAVLSLALATGPHAALFSVIDSLFIEPLGVAGADRLVAVNAPRTAAAKRSLSPTTAILRTKEPSSPMWWPGCGRPGP